MKQLKEAWNKSIRKAVACLQYEGLSDRRAKLILLGSIMLIAAIRIITIQSPAIDRTAWKEIDYIMISENYYRHGYEFLRPEISWPAEEPRVTAMEFPLVPYLAAMLYPLFGINAFSVRLAPLLFYLLLMAYMFKLVKREAGTTPALGSAFFAGIFPLFSPFRNTLFSEPAMIFFSVFSMYYFAQWADSGKKREAALFILGFSLAIALKPTALYLLLPLAWIHYRKYGLALRKAGAFLWPLAVAMILPALWYAHAYHLSQQHIDVFGIFGGQFGGHDKMQTLAMLSDINWYITMYWRLKMILLGEPGLLLMAIGGAFSLFYWRKGLLFIFYLLAIFVFFAIVAEGQIDAPYRQLTIIPPASFLITLGLLIFAVFTYTLATTLFGGLLRPLAGPATVLACLSVLVFFPARKRHVFVLNDKEAPVHTSNWILAGEIRKVASDSTKIILAGEYSIHKGGIDVSPVTYYYSGRQGWVIQKGQWSEAVVEGLKKKGASLLGAIGYSREPELEAFLKTLSEKYEVLFADPERKLLLLSLEEKKE